MINVKDANGKWVAIQFETLVDALENGSFRLWGYSMRQLLELTRYWERDNPRPPEV